LERSLVRMQAALARASGVSLTAPGMRPSPPSGWWGGGLLGLSAGAIALLVATGALGFFPLAMFTGIAGGLMLAMRPRLRPGAPAHIGMGATIASSAVVEPGAMVQMGATVRAGATIRSGAVVGMGSTVGANAVIEENAVVGWGSTVKAGAVVGANASLGWGATVGKGVQVPPGMRLRFGATVSAGWLKELLPGIPASATGLVSRRDPAEARAAAACDRLASELRDAPAHVRGFIGATEETVATLRRACEELFRRERVLRAELDPAALGRLEQDRRALEERLGTETDARTRNSLSGALAALDEQRRQRELLRLSAERIQAERMRLVYTLEGLAAQFVRLRDAGAEAGRAPSGELEQGVKQLGAELDAISEALEEESQSSGQAGVRGRE
jgi:carbonic anhydrase/acetyltransferase-like protein (isoleucine patch superfamily)